MLNVFDRVDTRLFKAFLSAAETKSFTQAAVAAGMTQSGVSQHIAKLEEQVGVPLFERVNKRVLLTTEGEEFKRFIETYADTLDSFVDRVGTQKSTPKGPVRYAMPASCLKTPHFSILLEKSLRYRAASYLETLLREDITVCAAALSKPSSRIRLRNAVR